MSTHQAKPEHEATYQELIALVGRHPELTAQEVLAIAANMVGKLVAMQDQRTLSSVAAMELVSRNIEIGNHQAIAQISGKAAGRA